MFFWFKIIINRFPKIIIFLMFVLFSYKNYQKIKKSLTSGFMALQCRKIQYI